MQPLDDRRPEIVYPCSWSYQVIGLEEGPMRKAVAEVIGEVPHTLEKGNVSTGGKYLALRLEMHVEDEARRLQVFERLAAHPAIRFVI